MPITEVTSREFRQNQREFFDRADRGESIIIKRGSKQSYVLIPITNGEINFSQEQAFQLIQPVAETNNK